MRCLGDYEKNLCQPNDTNCQPCPERLPSCVGKHDGDHAFPTKLWEQDYIVCHKERTVATKKCQKGYFHPTMEICTEHVKTSKKQFVYLYFVKRIHYVWLF
jgi:hypothetical protein